MDSVLVWLLIAKRLPISKDVVQHIAQYVWWNTTWNAANNVIGALAHNIRGDWSQNVEDRIDLMYEIGDAFGVFLFAMSDKEVQDACDDGRWFRDEWDGPYHEQCTVDDLQMIGYEEYIFNNPQYVVLK